MILAGIDQSLTGTGITINDQGSYKYYLLHSEKKESKSPSIEYTKRLMSIVRDVKEILKFHKVDIVAIEGMSFGSKGRIIFELGGLSHMCREMFLNEEIDFIVIPPKVLKKYWTEKGNASKEDMINEAYNRKCDIDLVKNYGTQKEPNIRFDDNVVDSRALCDFVGDYIKNNVNDLIDKVEFSF